MTKRWHMIGIGITLTMVAACGSSNGDTTNEPNTTTLATAPPSTAESATDDPAADTALDTDADTDDPTQADAANDADDADDAGSSAGSDTGTPGFDTWQDWQPATPQLGEVPTDLDAQLTWMYRSLIGLWAADDRLTTAALYDTISRTSDRRAAGVGMTDMLGTLTTLSADSYAIIGEAATAAAETGPASEVYFAPRAELAAVYVPSATGVHEQLVTLSSATRNDHYCFHEAIYDDECSDGVGGTVATAVIDQLETDDEVLRAIDIDDAEDTSDADVCAAWSRAVADSGLSDEQQLRLWVALDDSLLDTLIVGLSECMWELTGEEDPVIDDAAHDAALMPYLTAIADAAVTGGFTEEVYDLGGGSDEEVAEYLAIAEAAARSIMESAIAASSQTWSEVYDLELASRLYLVAGMSDALTGDVVDNLDRFELYWDGVEDEFCRAWDSALTDYGDGDRETIMFSFDNLRFGDVVMPGACT